MGSFGARSVLAALVAVWLVPNVEASGRSRPAVGMTEVPRDPTQPDVDKLWRKRRPEKDVVDQASSSVSKIGSSKLNPREHRYMHRKGVSSGRGRPIRKEVEDDMESSEMDYDYEPSMVQKGGSLYIPQPNVGSSGHVGSSGVESLSYLAEFDERSSHGGQSRIDHSLDTLGLRLDSEYPLEEETNIFEESLPVCDSLVDLRRASQSLVDSMRAATTVPRLLTIVVKAYNLLDAAVYTPELIVEAASSVELVPDLFANAVRALQQIVDPTTGKRPYRNFSIKKLSTMSMETAFADLSDRVREELGWTHPHEPMGIFASPPDVVRDILEYVLPSLYRRIPLISAILVHLHQVTFEFADRVTSIQESVAESVEEKPLGIGKLQYPQDSSTRIDLVGPLSDISSSWNLLIEASYGDI